MTLDSAQMTREKFTSTQNINVFAQEETQEKSTFKYQNVTYIPGIVLSGFLAPCVRVAWEELKSGTHHLAFPPTFPLLL